jgi:hypothetical protein
MNKNKPVNEILVGAIKATIWENKKENRVHHSVQISKLYKKGDSWDSTTNFSRADLPLVMKVSDLAIDYLYGVNEK